MRTIYLYTVFLFLYPTLGQAQKKIYLNKHKQVTNKAEAVYYKQFKKINKVSMMQISLASNGRKVFEAEVLKTDREVKNGPCKAWHNNGRLMGEGQYKYNRKVGTWRSYNKWGRPTSVISFRDGKEYFHQIWDKYEKKQLENGTGLVVEKMVLRDDSLVSVYQDSLFIRSYFIDQSDTIHVEPNRKAAFKTGRKSLYDLLGTNVRYPNAAKRLGITGSVQVHIFVDEEGKVTKAEAVQGIGAGCDEEAERVMFLSSGYWIPAEFEGKQVKSMVHLPVHFLKYKKPPKNKRKK